MRQHNQIPMKYSYVMFSSHLSTNKATSFSDMPKSSGLKSTPNTELIPRCLHFGSLALIYHIQYKSLHFLIKTSC